MFHVENMELDIRIFHAAKKTFPAKPIWKRRDEERIILVSPLDINGVTIEGLNFRATALLRRRDECVTFQLEYFPTGSSAKGGPIERVEWRPLRGHNNKQIGPVELRNLIQRGSHHHDFLLNWEHNQDALRKGDLPISVPITPEPAFIETLEFVGNAFNISPIDWVSEPPWPEWQPQLI